MTLTQASRKAAEVIQQSFRLKRLFQVAVRRYGEGEIYLLVLELIDQAYRDGKLDRDIFEHSESLISFCCGVWIQFLLVEVAGVRKDRLHAVARRLVRGTDSRHRVH